MTRPLVAIEGLSKTFPGLQALQDVGFAAQPGEIVALVGQNGSGKSTLVKILAGVEAPDPGARVDVAGTVHVIHQDLGLIPQLNTVENLDLGLRHGLGAALPTRRREEAEHARALLRQYDAAFDVTVPVGQLTPAERTIVAIARALDGWERAKGLLILDEPTAALHSDEVGRLFTAVRRAAAAGAAVIFVSHRLDEVLDLADRVVVLRDGRLVSDAPVAALDHAELVRLIVGAAPQHAAPREPCGPGAVALQVRGLRGGRVRDFQLDLCAGEVVGVSGILGSGREHVGALLFGALPRAGGDVAIGGSTLAGGDPRAAIGAGVAYVPGDRHADGAVMTMLVRENVTLPNLRRLRRRAGRLDGRAERQEVVGWLERIALRPADPERPLELFSGGNQQKVVLAKWLRNDPRVLLLDEPTQGVDVGAKAAVYALVRDAAARGAAVLMASSDTAELASVCDRVLVMRDGTVSADVRGAHLTEERLVIEGLALATTNGDPCHD
ncbi:sugar ABC transporter ATP-binding protein [Solirubrobacter ginsenosidimutans]|uniref:Sugar ABC transporter ATP-binding protein n=1 Tax=Solirubrobacter ginsenosidimutans TaxID=490573 RepID=A0A9X3N1R3_9ACTN|nr:sugar ABC transporter ATP-binding protein [Solirubrobacter ginsenosidimutans]MDA0166854.1 sugar ABC transporter ATP-binding protein [Solirubrobacter ginsenosidimutans]